MVSALLLALAVGQSPAVDPSKLEGIPAPLGSIGDVVQPPKEGGLKSGELVVVDSLEGFQKPQAFYLTRFYAGAVEAARAVQRWLDSPRGGGAAKLERKLFGKRRRLLEALERAASSVPVDAGLCDEAGVAEGWKLALRSAPKGCKVERVAGAGATALFTEKAAGPDPKSITAAVKLSPAPADRADRCRGRLSAVLFDKSGAARFGYHADYGGALSVEVVGDGCRILAFEYHEEGGVFRPTWRRAEGCR